MQASLRPLGNRVFKCLLALAVLGACAGAQAEGPLRYKCSTTMKFGPSHCPGNIPPIQDNSVLEIDLERNLWKSDHMTGAIETQGSVVTLKKWGAGMVGRDASFDRANGNFNYFHESGCLVENQTGTCQSIPAP